MSKDPDVCETNRGGGGNSSPETSAGAPAHAVQLSLCALERGVVSLEGELQTEVLDLDLRDDLVRPADRMRYALKAERFGDAVMLMGSLELLLHCTCVRCLRKFDHLLALRSWVCHVPLAGDDRAEALNDVVDLTPYVREDTLLSLPRHPLCEPGCCGLPSAPRSEDPLSGRSRPALENPSLWAELDKLKF